MFCFIFLFFVSASFRKIIVIKISLVMNVYNNFCNACNVLWKFPCVFVHLKLQNCGIPKGKNAKIKNNFKKYIHIRKKSIHICFTHVLPDLVLRMFFPLLRLKGFIDHWHIPIPVLCNVSKGKNGRSPRQMINELYIIMSETKNQSFLTI